MKHEYNSDELLPLSGIQHFVFCRRQWALIHVEHQWQENMLTVDGRLLHQRTDDPFLNEARNGWLIARAMPVSSYRLGLNGICDVVEFVPSDDGVNLYGHSGRYRVAPVEYKRGSPKRDPCDEAQLCAQAMCLEEMLSTTIPVAHLYYGETRHRLDVPLGNDLRTLVVNASAEMHQYIERGYTPRVRTSKACKSCSLVDVCLPDLQADRVNVHANIREHLVKG